MRRLAASTLALVLFASPNYAQTMTAPTQPTDAKTSVASTAPTKSRTVADTAIRPFTYNAPEAELVDLKRRIAATRWPDKETVADQSLGAARASHGRPARDIPAAARGEGRGHRTVTA